MTAEFPLAVHALVYLMHKGTVISSQELADNICTNPARVRKVMIKLHAAGLVQTTRGKGSGYIYGGAENLSLKMVLEALNEKPVSMNWQSGDMDKECLVASGMAKIMDDVYGEMNKACMAKLEDITIAALNSLIFK